MKKTLSLRIPAKSGLSFIFPAARAILLFVFFVSFHFSVISQNLQWAKAIGGNYSDWGYSIAVDASGNVYTTGYFSGTVDFDPGAGNFNLTSAGWNDIFISKLDASGNFVWAKSMGGTGGGAEGYSITVDASGNIYTTGYFQGTADFDPGAGNFNLTSAGNDDIFISKLDALGNFVWAKSLGGTVDDVGQSITFDASGNVYTTGHFYGTVDFDPGAGNFNLTAAGFFDIFISKLDASGNFVWAKSMGGTGYDGSQSIAVDASGNVYTTGDFQGTVDFDPGAGNFNLTSAGNYDIFVSKLDASGNFIWAKSMGGTVYEQGHSIAVDASGNIYTTGYFDGTADFDPGAGNFNLTATGSNDIFVSKLDASGNFVWARSMGGGNAVGSSIALDASGNVYTTGEFMGTIDFDPGAGNFNLTATGGFDIFISKLDTSGNFIWVRSMGGTVDDGGQSIAVDASGNVYTTGFFKGTADFDPGSGIVNLTSNGQEDIFVAKYDQVISAIVSEISSDNLVSIYPNPSNDMITISLAIANTTADVYDLTGNKVASFILQSTTSQIDLSNLSNGSYFLTINTANGVYHKKITKTN